jgi:hypothetical protein
MTHNGPRLKGTRTGHPVKGDIGRCEAVANLNRPGGNVTGVSFVSATSMIIFQ